MTANKLNWTRNGVRSNSPSKKDRVPETKDRQNDSIKFDETGGILNGGISVLRDV